MASSSSAVSRPKSPRWGWRPRDTQLGRSDPLRCHRTLRQHTELPGQLTRRQLVDVLAVQQHLTALWNQQSAHPTQQGRLAGPVRPDHSGRPPRRLDHPHRPDQDLQRTGPGQVRLIRSP